MFGRATIRLGIGPHSSYAYLTVACICDKQVSKGLWKKYGDGRVKDTPITEVGKHVAIVISNCQVQNNA